MANIFFLLLSMLLGILLRRYEPHAAGLSKWLRRIVVWICLPAMVLAYIPKIQWRWTHLYPMAMPYLNFVLSFLFFTALAWIQSKNFPKGETQPRRRLGALILMGGLGNTSFVGFPLLLAFYGPEALKTAIVIDQAGSFIVILTLGLFCASYFSGKSLHVRTWLRRTLTYPSFLAFVISIAIGLWGYQLLPQVEKILHGIASPLSYLAMILSGLNLRFRSMRVYRSWLSISLLFKLVLFPLIILGLYGGCGLLGGLPLKVTVMEAAMPPMVSAGILALEYRLDEELAMLHLAVGIPLSFVTLTLWHYVLNFF